MSPEEMIKLLEPIRPQLIGFAQKVTGRDTSYAEDLVQDAYVQLLRYADRFEGSNPTPWMLTVISNRAKSLWRRNKFCDPKINFEDLPEVPIPSDSFDKIYIDQILQKAGTDVYGFELLLNFGLGFGYDEVSALSDMPIGTVKSRSA